MIGVDKANRRCNLSVHVVEYISKHENNKRLTIIEHVLGFRKGGSNNNNT
ncbi:hypothetical protein HanRHA438_Chr08g0370301 [Helianthus annuus]|uniref:Uncharacterized protein n=1 Tax=Helianthus annuus TaxID=4232 RepID=A0A9K3IHP2_HELAN|nr:hypothetical protein HanXRQr2_Chr08g0358211 [Helianthus annuus]KAJ0899591.1 hypothetical protein HanRHA438_Chr08g0370301 [Helianthus annuus]KAJ0903156.1 hypothetical protein HanPSC8_Chr08g0345721 [Helianthus annuus]